MDFLNKVLEIIKEKNDGQDLDLDSMEYHLFLNDAHVLVYFDMEENSIKVNVEMFDEGCAKVTFADEGLEDLM